jgi:hypothetical protein
VGQETNGTAPPRLFPPCPLSRLFPPRVPEFRVDHHYDEAEYPRGRMRGVKRRVFNVAAAVSLALCVALLALAVRSCWIEEWFFVGVGSAQCVVRSSTAEMRIILLTNRFPTQSAEYKYGRVPLPSGEISARDVIYFDCYAVAPHLHIATGPNWALAAPLGCLAWWLRRNARKLAPRSGFAVEPITTAAQKP